MIPPNAPLGAMLPNLKKWESISPEDQAFKAKSMAVNAGMLEAMDEHIGRYIDFLKANDKSSSSLLIMGRKLRCRRYTYYVTLA